MKKEINFRSDFKVFLESESGWSVPFRVTLYTAGNKQKGCVVAYDGHEYEGCHVDELGRLVVAVDNAGMGMGALLADVEVYLTDKDYADGVCNATWTVGVKDADGNALVLTAQGETDVDIAAVLPPFYQVGPQGERGPQGEQGPQGEPGPSVTVINDLTTGGADKALSAEMGKVLAKEATTEHKGLMSAEDKKRLDNGIHEIGSDSIEGYFVGTTDVANSAFRATDYIPIIGYEYITILKGSYANESYKCLCFYTSEKKLLAEGQQNNYNVGDKIDIPEGACYVRAFIATYSAVGTSILIGASVDSLRESCVKTNSSLEDLKKEVDELQNKEANLVPINQAESMQAGFITANGTIVEHSAFINTGYIDISKYKKAIIKTGNSQSYDNPQYHAIHYYDDKKNQIGYADGFTANQELVFLDGAHYIAVFVQSYAQSITLHVPTEEYLLMQVASNTEAVDALSIKEWEIIKTYFFAGIPKYIDVPVGDNSYIYLQNMSSIDLEFMSKASVAATVTKSYTDEAFTNEPLFTKYNSKVIAITPTSAQMAKMWITVKNNLFENTAEAILRIRGVKRQGGDGSTKNILIVGDSLIESSKAALRVFSELVSDGDYVINKIGTLQNGLCEGRGSWSWSTYTNPLYETTPYNNYTNPFMNNGVLDFKNYMSVNYPSLQGIDIAVISLGTNDMGQNGTGTTEEMQAKAVTAVGKAKIFIDALLRDYPNCKIALGLPSFGAKYSSNNLYAYGFARSIMLYNKLMVETFDNGIYHSNVTCVPQGLFIDRNNAYPHTDVEINGESHRFYNDFIHPTNIGLEEFGWAYYAKIRAILNGLL